MPKSTPPIHPPELVIKKLGGAKKVAKLCELSLQAVYQWYGVHPVTGRARRIPPAWLKFLRKVRSKEFAELDAEYARQHPIISVPGYTGPDRRRKEGKVAA